ncbi:type I DNA topoisomerase [Lutispora thermophila]|uniref:DNA topoisomerase 1 n=1 Tax=Lutispora thermophila DSM 19022 TaxID=1122184 RepID=A0A1M6G624_9FIRM|nr:type I DNA topoisomerase [Lutispora thermophila]SHJ05401.1 DNA topoisomerase-1 [Lutispora thermophila DSM 19022]
MKTTLIIVESPAKVKTIKKFLSSGYKVEATMGHIRDLPKSQLGIDIENDFQPKYITIRGKGQTLDKLKKEAKGCDRIYLATDPDREGEAISWHLSKVLGIDPTDSCRIEFNEITKTAVKNAIKNPRNINMDLVDAQQARRVLDRLVGYKISPLLWKKVKKGLSAGRVQSVAVKLIYDREEEIRAFESKEYWDLSARLFDNNSKKTIEAKFYGDNKNKIEINSQDEMEELLKKLEGEEYKVSKIKKGEKKRNAPLPFTTSTLQQEAYRKLGFSTKKTMMIAQQLYEGVDIKGEGTVGLVSYIRTDSTRLSEEAKADAKKFIIERYGDIYYRKNNNQVKSGKKIQDAHEGIRPTSAFREPNLIKDSLDKDQYKLYDLIWTRFIASQMESAVYDIVTIDITAGNYLFKATGSAVKFQGFMLVYTEGKDEKEEDKDVILPEVHEGQVLKLKKLEPKQHFTEPPPRYTEATLVKALEEKGIGRPSTYAPIISTILARGYVIKEKKYLKTTELGEAVTKLLIENFKDIINVEFTANMERDLDKIADGEEKWIDVIKRFYMPFQETLKIAEERIGKIDIPDEVSEEVCEFCGRNLVYKMGKYGKFLACPGFPECKNTKPIVENTGVKCPKCSNGQLIARKSKRGRKFYGCSNYPNCDFTTWDEPTNEICPKCGSHLAKKSNNRQMLLKCLNENCDYEKQANNK